MSASVDPKLANAILQGKARDGKVHAAFTLRGVKGEVLTPEKTDALVKEMVGKASSLTNKMADKLVVFKNLQSFSIEAPADLVEKLADEDAIGTAALGS